MKLAYCGLDCETCEALIATQKNDDALRRKIAEQWSKQFNAAIPPEGINCTGCRGEGVKLYYCSELCQVRKCAREKNVDHCGLCGEYPCPRVEEITGKVPAAKQRLEERRPV